MASQPLEVFVSYAHADKALKDELLKHLSPLKRRGLIAHWQDRDISAGSEWAGEIDDRLNRADIILLLISPDFLHSDFCYDNEMTRALERHAAGECRVIPVFLRSCDWKGLEFGKLQGVPDDAVPVVSSHWPSQDDAFTRVAAEIRRVVERFQVATPVSRPAPSATPAVVKARSEPEHRVGDWLDDSGAAVLISDQCFESESVIDLDDNRVEVKIAPQTGAEEATLRSFQENRYGNAQEISFAHRNQGFLAHVRSAKSQSFAGRIVWTLELDRDGRNRDSFHEVTVGKVTPDKIAEARAWLLLLGEQPKGHLREAADFIVGASVFGGLRAKNSGCIFPELWDKCGGDIVKFLRWARLTAVFRLKTEGICQHVLHLELSLREEGILAVGFDGLRQSHYGSETQKISAYGHCALKPLRK